MSTATFDIISIHTSTEYEAEIFTDVPRGHALDLIEQRGDHGASAVEGYLGVQLEKTAMHQYKSTDHRFKVIMRAVKQ